MAAYIPALGDLESELVMSPTRLRLSRRHSRPKPLQSVLGIIIPPPLRSVESDNTQQPTFLTEFLAANDSASVALLASIVYSSCGAPTGQLYASVG